MAHTCPDCGQVCHCGGDIDDIVFDIASKYCCHCEEEDNEFSLFGDGCIDEDFDALEETDNPNDSRNV